MNIEYAFNGVVFEWDDRKAARNLHKHNVAFELACEVFFDPFVYYLDDELINGELRETIIGLSARWQLLYVVYVMRDESIRIISARLVTNPERQTYENQ